MANDAALTATMPGAAPTDGAAGAGASSALLMGASRGCHIARPERLCGSDQARKPMPHGLAVVS